MTKIGAFVAIFACVSATATQGSSLEADFQAARTQIHAAQRKI